MATFDYSFVNAPSSRSHTIGNHSVTYQNHHVISIEAFGKSSFMNALQANGLWSQNDFRLNGLQLPDTINGQNVNDFAGREAVVGAAAHTGGHTNYNNSQTRILGSFDKSYETFRGNPSLNWDGFGSEQAWLQHQSKKIYGYVGFLKGELTNPNSVIKLHGRDSSVTNLTSGETWNAFDRQQVGWVNGVIVGCISSCVMHRAAED